MLTVRSPVRFEELYRVGYRRVYRLIWVLAGPSAAEELTQDAFLRAHRNWNEVVELDDPLQWVSRVARNLAISRFRRLGAEARAMTRLGRPEPVRVSEPATDVWEAVRSLPRRQREVVVLCYLEGFTRFEAAAELDISPETVKTHLDRARTSLANRLEGHP